MPSIPLIATQSFAYAGKRLRAGDRFTASDRDAKLLKALKRATAVPVEQTPPLKLRTRALTPEPVQPPAPVRPQPPEPSDETAPTGDDAPLELGEDSTRPKRTYRRRDLTAEN